MEFLTSLSESTQFFLQLIVVLGCLFYGAKKGGMALGVLGGIGLVILVFALRSLSFFLQCLAGKCGSLHDAWRHLRQRKANEPHRVDTARRLGFDPYAFLARRHFFFRLPQAARLVVCRHYGLCFGRDYPQLVKPASLILTNK